MLVVCNKFECVPTSKGQVAKHVFYNSQRQGSCCLCLAQSTKQAFQSLQQVQVLAKSFRANLL
jgi:hypothetical protein